MKKILVSSLALLFITALAMPASAFVLVFGEIDKDKNIYVDQNVEVEKYFTIDVTVGPVVGTFAAEADAVVNQDNFGNSACENCAEKVATIDLSVLSNVGVTNVNQAVGNMNNQGNVVAVGVDFQGPPSDGGGPPAAEGDGFANSQAMTSQVTGLALYPVSGTDQGRLILSPPGYAQLIDEDGNVVTTITWPGIGVWPAPNTINSAGILFRDAVIQSSVNENLGITNVNQAAGQMNNQANVSAIAACLNGAVAIAEADLGQATALSYVYESDTNKTASITSSVLLNKGVTFVNQTSGNMANQANNLSLAVALHP